MASDTFSSAAFQRRRSWHLCILGGIWADHDASSDLCVDCIILLHASAWEKLCKLYGLVVPVKPVGCYKGNDYALATFGQVSPGLPGTTLMRCRDKINSLKSRGSFLHFLPMSLQHSVGNPILYLCPSWNCVSSDPIATEADVERGEYKRKQTPGGKFFTYNSFWQEMFCSFQQNFVTIFKILISLYSNFAFHFLLLRIQFLLS